MPTMIDVLAFPSPGTPLADFIFGDVVIASPLIYVLVATVTPFIVGALVSIARNTLKTNRILNETVLIQRNHGESLEDHEARIRTLENERRAQRDR